MGKKIVLWGFVSTDTTAPVLPQVDPLEINGSLLLIDPAHPIKPWDAGVPIDQALVPNVLWSRALTTTGGGTEASLSASVWRKFASTAEGVVERSTKGGLHVIVSPTTLSAANKYAAVALPVPVKTYMKANTSHAYYYSQWARVTRADTNATDGHPILIVSTNSYFGISLAARPIGSNSTGENAGTAPVIGSTGPPANLVGGEFRAIADEPNPLFASDTDNNQYGENAAMFLVGQRSNPTLGLTGHSSRILYRAYLEDLTVSGRTYAQVEALDRSLYTKEVLTVGGRYYGDTYTNPSTVA